MSWIPEHAPRNLLASVSGSWNDWADGGDIATPPHRKPPEVFACRILKTMTDPNGIVFKAGMEGQYLGMRNDTMATIFIQGLTEGDGFTNRVYPRANLQIGKPWKSDIRDWQLSINLETQRFNANDWRQAAQPDGTVFGKTIVRLIEGFVKEGPPNAPPKLINYLDKLNITAASQKIIQGVKNAGLYKLLSDPEPFTAQDLINDAKFKIKGSGLETLGGVYARIHVSNDMVTLWEKNMSYLYIGKSTDFDSRFLSHRYTSSSYGDLTRNSHLTAIALCVLDASEDPNLYFLTEQVFVCLFETYRPDVLLSTTTNIDSIEYLKFVQSARYLTDLATAVFETTGWQGGVSRGEEFAVLRGANCSSPLLEIASGWEKHLYIRTDANIKNGKTGKVVPMAIYHRSNPAKNNRTKVREKDGGAPVVLRVSNMRDNKRHDIVDITYYFTDKTPASQWPLPGTSYEIVIEVCKDGSQHPQAWAKLPDIGSFQNSNQANSFAVRIEWQNPPDSGKWRFNYVKARRMWKMVDDKQPGSLPTHAKAITFLHWLTNSPHRHGQAWVEKGAGCARVLQAKYNLMDQSVRFVEPDKDIKMLPGTALSSTAIESQMRKPEYGLKDVGGQYGGNFVGSGRKNIKSRRTRCDTCVVLIDKNQQVGPCRQYKNTNGCTNCVNVFARYSCSWTEALLTSEETVTKTRSPEQRAATAIARKALVVQPDYAVWDPVRFFKQTLRQLEDSEQIIDDADEFEIDESDDEID